MREMKLYQDKDWLYKKYIEKKLSTHKIAEIIDSNHRTILYWLVKFKIKTRNKLESSKERMKRKYLGTPLFWDKNWLEQKYIKEGLSSNDIGKICNVGWSTIINWLKKHRIKIKNNREAHLGRELSDEHRKKISKALKGQIPWIKGLTSDQDNRIATGKRHGMWLGGISFEPYGVAFNEILKEQIRKRDNYTCQMLDCGAVQNGRKFPVHHSDYDKRNNEDSNLITLCHSCHPKTNANRKYWESYFKEN